MHASLQQHTHTHTHTHTHISKHTNKQTNKQPEFEALQRMQHNVPGNPMIIERVNIIAQKSLANKNAGQSNNNKNSPRTTVSQAWAKANTQLALPRPRDRGRWGERGRWDQHLVEGLTQSNKSKTHYHLPAYHYLYEWLTVWILQRVHIAGYLAFLRMFVILALDLFISLYYFNELHSSIQLATQSQEWTGHQ